MNREKVIKGLECCTFILGKRKCNECPYQKELPDNGCYQLQDDFHALLKEKEAVKPITEDYMYKCGDCKWSFFSMDSTNILSMMQSVKFCPHCGKPVLWEGR